MRLREQIDEDANPEHHTNTNSEAILKVNNDRASTENSLSSWGDRAAWCGVKEVEQDQRAKRGKRSREE